MSSLEFLLWLLFTTFVFDSLTNASGGGICVLHRSVLLDSTMFKCVALILRIISIVIIMINVTSNFVIPSKLAIDPLCVQGI